MVTGLDLFMHESTKSSVTAFPLQRTLGYDLGCNGSNKLEQITFIDFRRYWDVEGRHSYQPMNLGLCVSVLELK